MHGEESRGREPLATIAWWDDVRPWMDRESALLIAERARVLHWKERDFPGG